MFIYHNSHITEYASFNSFCMTLKKYDQEKSSFINSDGLFDEDRFCEYVKNSENKEQPLVCFSDEDELFSKIFDLSDNLSFNILKSALEECPQILSNDTQEELNELFKNQSSSKLEQEDLHYIFLKNQFENFIKKEHPNDEVIFTDEISLSSSEALNLLFFNNDSEYEDNDYYYDEFINDDKKYCQNLFERDLNYFFKKQNLSKSTIDKLYSTYENMKNDYVFSEIYDNHTYIVAKPNISVTVPLEVRLDNGDANYEYSLIGELQNFIYSYDGELTDNDIKYAVDNYKDCSLFLLAKTQGYSEKDLILTLHNFYHNAIKPDSAFLNSVCHEFFDFDTYINNGSISFIIQPSFETAKELIEQIKAEQNCSKEFYPNTYTGSSNITIGGANYNSNNPDYLCGIFNPINGGGCGFDIILDKPAVIPLGNIKVQPAIGKGVICYTYGDVYGTSNNICNENGIKNANFMSSEEIKKAEINLKKSLQNQKKSLSR